MSDAINHHAVPDFYLKKFRDPALSGKKVWQYAKGRMPKPIPTKRAEAFAHYNTFLTSPAESLLLRYDSNIMEMALGEYETKAGELFKKIESLTFNSSDKESFAKWISVQLTRVTCFRDWVLEGFHRKHNVRVGPSYALTHVEDVYYQEICSLNWWYVEAPAGSFFVTSDNPVYFWSNVIVYPLNPQLALVMGDQAEAWVNADSEMVEMMNLKTIEGAFKHVYAPKNLASVNAAVQAGLGINNLPGLRHDEKPRLCLPRSPA